MGGDGITPIRIQIMNFECPCIIPSKLSLMAIIICMKATWYKIRGPERSFQGLSTIIKQQSAYLLLAVRTHPFHITGFLTFLLANHLSAFFSAVMMFAFAAVVVRFKIDIFLLRIKER